MTTMLFDKLHLKDAKFQNPRTSSGLDDESIRELAINIGLHGMLNPLLVLEDGLIVDGQRRYRAVEFLLQWFSHNSTLRRETFGELTRAEVTMIGDLTHADISVIEATVKYFEDHGLPVKVLTAAPLALGTSADGIALANNLQRADLSSFEVAAHVAHMISQGATQADIVRLIGKSKTYVSRKVTAYNGACDELRAAWAAGQLTEEHVQDLAKLPHDQQRRQLAGPIPRGRRGPAHRPGIDTVKEVLGSLRTSVPMVATDTGSYAAGVVDALRWVAGDDTSGAFAKLMEVVDASAT